jgi:hypothetical protein
VAFIDGAAIACSKKPSKGWYVFSFLATAHRAFRFRLETV